MTIFLLVKSQKEKRKKLNETNLITTSKEEVVPQEYLINNRNNKKYQLKSKYRSRLTLHNNNKTFQKSKNKCY